MKWTHYVVDLILGGDEIDEGKAFRGEEGGKGARPSKFQYVLRMAIKEPN